MIGHGPTRDFFERTRILDFLELTHDIPAFDPTLFSIALCFWTSDYNTFVFSLSPMSVTLRDISALTNLPHRASTSSPVASQSPIILGLPAIPIIQEPQSSEPLNQEAEMAQSPPNEVAPVEMPIVEEPPRPDDKRKTSAVPEEQSKIVVSPSSPKATDEVVLAYTSFMNKDISKASAANQRELLARLSEDLASALKRPTLELPADIRLTLREIHQEVSLLLSENMELKSKKMSVVQAMAEKD
ncbi:hypothetical protein Adt_03060 [Abeliophyllum distichum]|uniref:Uncharacterized protein n=1 Tax=Abeliophyllum distichum TaxID=126358 RepID=A0ABD1VXF7_9LAMI